MPPDPFSVALMETKKWDFVGFRERKVLCFKWVFGDKDGGRWVGGDESKAMDIFLGSER